MVANGSEPREILLDPMIAGSRGADGCEFDLEVDRASLTLPVPILIAGVTSAIHTSIGNVLPSWGPMSIRRS